MDNYYQMNLPTGMAPVHPEPYSTVIPSLAATDAGRVFVSGTTHSNFTCNLQDSSPSGISEQDIFRFNPDTNQKKEVYDIEMNRVQHCRSIQYNMKLFSGQEFFNNAMFIY